MKSEKNIEKKSKNKKEDTKSSANSKEKESSNDLKMDFMTAMKKILTTKPIKTSLFMLFSLLSFIKNLIIFNSK